MKIDFRTIPQAAPGPALGVKVEGQGSAAVLRQDSPTHWFTAVEVTVYFSQHLISQSTGYLEKVKIPFFFSYSAGVGNNTGPFLLIICESHLSHSEFPCRIRNWGGGGGSSRHTTQTSYPNSIHFSLGEVIQKNKKMTFLDNFLDSRGEQQIF